MNIVGPRMDTQINCRISAFQKESKESPISHQRSKLITHDVNVLGQFPVSALSLSTQKSDKNELNQENNRDLFCIKN